MLEIPSFVQQHLDVLHHYELFLRLFNLVDNGRCTLCDSSFPSSLRLIAHCDQHHRVEVTPELRRVFSQMSPRVTASTAPWSILTMKELRADLLLVKPEKFAPCEADCWPRRVPTLLADFVFETFAVDKIEPWRTPKQFADAPRVWLRLPVPLPVVFRPADVAGKTLLEVVGTQAASAGDIWEQVNLVLNRFHREKILVMRIVEVADRAFSDDVFDGICGKFDLVMLKSKDVPVGDARNFAVYIMGGAREQAKRRLEEEFLKCKLSICRKCQQVYDPEHPENCPGPKLGKLQIQVKRTGHEAAPGSPSSFAFEDVTVAEVIDK
jgi:hypothetical protein